MCKGKRKHFSVLCNFSSEELRRNLQSRRQDQWSEFEVFCDQKTAGGGWTMFQRRRDGSVDFFRGWEDYKRGFGNLNGEFWLGLDKIHRLTVSASNKLRVVLEDIHGSTAYAVYSSLAVASERVKYQLSLGSYSGTLTDVDFLN